MRASLILLSAVGLRALAPTVRSGAAPIDAATLRVPRTARAPCCCATDSDAGALLSSLQRVSARRGEVVVVKYGGHAMTNDERAAEFASDMALLQSLGLRPVVVHGGGPQINEMLSRLEVESTFVNGLRVTSPAVMEVAEMVLGSLNKKIASAINAAGGRAVGLSGKDDTLVSARQKSQDLGLVGQVEHVRTPLLDLLLDEGVVPVIAPVATGDGCSSYNVNADTMAGAIAGALNAQQLLLLTDVEGVLDDDKQLLPTLTTAAAQQLCDDGIATGGMIPKLGTAIGAVKSGTGAAVIMDGRVPHCSLMHLFGSDPVGTAVSD